jgi:hypothetical protein
LDLALTLVFSAVHLGSQGANDKEKMRSTLKTLMMSYLGYSEEEFTFMKRDGNHIGDNCWEDFQVDDFTTKDYYDLKSNYSFKYEMTHYEWPRQQEGQDQPE